MIDDDDDDEEKDDGDGAGLLFTLGFYKKYS